MDQSIEKLLDEKTPEEERKALKDSLTPEQQVEYAQEARKVFEAELAKAAGARKEKARIDDLIKEKTDEIGKVNETMNQFRKDQVQKAKERILREVKLEGEKLAEFETNFEKLDSGKADADLIYKDMQKAALAADPEQYMAAQKAQEAAAAAAAAATAAAAGSHQSQPGNDQPEFNKEVTDFQTQIGAETPEQAQRIMQDGGTRRLE